MKTLNAFLVEDSPIIRESLIELLEELSPLKVIGVAEDEGQATEWLARHNDECQVVIIDIFLKRGSGLGVLQAARDIGGAHLIVLTNYASDALRQGCTRLGAERVFDKFHDIEELAAYCRALVQDR